MIRKQAADEWLWQCGPDCACKEDDALTIEITTEEQE